MVLAIKDARMMTVFLNVPLSLILVFGWFSCESCVLLLLKSKLAARGLFVL